MKGILATGGLLLLALTALPASAGTLYRCVDTDGVSNYVNKRIPGADCKVFQRYVPDRRAYRPATAHAASAPVPAAATAASAANAARTSVIEYRQLSDDCKAKIAASAAAGVVFATQADIDAQYDTVIAPALSDAETIPPLTQSDIDWALDIINR